MGEPVVVPIASNEESSQQFALKEESKLFASSEESIKRLFPVVVVPKERQTFVVINSTPVVVVPNGKNDGMGHQPSSVVSSQQRSCSQFAEVSNSGVVVKSLRNKSSREPSHHVTQDPKAKDLLQHRQDPPRRAAKLYRQLKNAV